MNATKHRAFQPVVTLRPERRSQRVLLAIALDNLWLLVMLLPFALVIRYGVVAREEAYLERKFGDVYRAYRSRVRRWL
jgi:protein-S-isoprenylcysteine O-methyltransferase Ste14